tara:strand:- start:4358 stop:5584 length:1227 start_codon:yes stop_codon:yes gene_type:complete
MKYINLLALFFVLLILCKVFIKIKYKFWAYQPVFHYYDLWYWIYQKGIINKDLPETNKFCNFINVYTKEYNEYDKNSLKEIIGFIRTHYYRSKNANYLPTLEAFSSYFIGNNSKTFISTYNKPIVIVDKNLKTTTDNEILGVMTGRPVNITITDKDPFRAYYIDYLCVHKEHRKDGIAPEIIQSHEYIQRHKNKKIYVSLFKREGDITGIVALTNYKTYQFNVKQFQRCNLSHASMQLIEINKLNAHLLMTFIYKQKIKFDCLVLPDYGNILNLINNNTYYVYGIIENNELIACYFFRNSYMSYDMRNDTEKENEKKIVYQKSVECFASISNCHHNEIFIKGFSIALYKYSKHIKADLITIENISHNNIIINNLFLLNIVPLIVSPTAYFYYNYVKKPILPEKTFIIC